MMQYTIAGFAFRRSEEILDCRATKARLAGIGAVGVMMGGIAWPLIVVIIVGLVQGSVYPVFERPPHWTGWVVGWALCGILVLVHLFFLLAMALASLSSIVYALATGHIPMILDCRAGGFFRGKREVCPLSRIEGVQICEVRGAEGDVDHRVAFLFAGGPGEVHDLSSFISPTHARAFAREFADFLGVAVVEGEKPKASKASRDLVALADDSLAGDRLQWGG
jgi:hypothetical protein